MLKIFNSLIGVNIQNYEGGFKLYGKWSEYLFTAVRVLSVPTEDISNQYPIKKVKLSCPFHEFAKFPFNLNRVILAFSAMYFICIPLGIIYKWFKGFNSMPILIKTMVRDQHVYCLTTSSRSKFSQYRAITWKIVERI